MASKIRKEIVQTYQDRLDKENSINECLENIYQSEPQKKFIEKDIENFIENYFDMKRSLNFYIKNKEKTISIVWEEPNYSLIVEFFGNGYWEYELIKTKAHNSSGEGKITIKWAGLAYEYRIPSESGEKRYLFLLEDDVEKVTRLTDVFEYNYEPVFEIDNSYKKFTNKVRMGWSCLYYDGPINGYCYFSNSLHYFSSIEECEFTSQRMYAIYKLNSIDKLKAYWKHFRIVSYLKNQKLINKINLFKHNMKTKIANIFKYLKINSNNQKSISNKDFVKNKKIIGYFTF